jgi:hypothetical protein
LQYDATTLSIPEYHIRNRNSVQIYNASQPIKFNGVSIGTTELPAAPTNTIQFLSEGHHFNHKGWHLTEKNGGSWKCSGKPKLSLAKRIGTPEEAEMFEWTVGFSCVDTQAGSTRIFHESLQDVELTSSVDVNSAAVRIDYDIGGSDIWTYDINLRDSDGKTVASSTGTSGSISNIPFK